MKEIVWMLKFLRMSIPGAVNNDMRGRGAWASLARQNGGAVNKCIKHVLLGFAFHTIPYQGGVAWQPAGARAPGSNHLRMLVACVVLITSPFYPTSSIGTRTRWCGAEGSSPGGRG